MYLLLCYCHVFYVGELSLLRSPSCSSRELVYICSVNSGATDWEFADIRSSFGRDTSELGEVLNFTATSNVGNSPGSFEVTNSSDELFSITLTIQDAVSLNNTMVTCNEQQTVIRVMLPGKHNIDCSIK